MSAALGSTTERLRIYVRLLDEGTEVSRPTEAFKILSTADYDPENETWEFPPGAIVRAETRHGETGEYLLATKP